MKKNRLSPSFVSGLVLGAILLAVALILLWTAGRRSAAAAQAAANAKQEAQQAQEAAATATHTSDGIRIHGAEAGEWTHDWEAAIALGRAERRPVLALFTASDWNDWHKFLVRRVFDTKTWAAWLDKRLVLVWINHPNNGALVPPEYRQRNLTLTRQYGADAFPAAILLSAATRQPYDRYHVTRETDAADFIAWTCRTAMDNQPGGVKAFLSAEDVAALEALREERLPLARAYEAAVKEANAEYDAFRERGTSSDGLAEWAKASDEKLAALKAPVAALDQKIAVLYAKAFDACFPRGD
jgi:hypothetical protein